MTPYGFAGENHSADQSLVSKARLEILKVSWFVSEASGGARTNPGAVLETVAIRNERSDSTLGVVVLLGFLCVQKHDSNSNCWKNSLR